MPRGRQKAATPSRTSHPPKPEGNPSGSDKHIYKSTSAGSDYQVPEKLTSVSKDKRLNRNQSEKQRRDRLNSHIAELAQCLPLVVSANKKLDKSSILRLAVNFLRLHHDFVKDGDHPLRCHDVLPDEASLRALLEESEGGFILVVNQKDCQITYASDGITEKLGHYLVDIIGSNISNVIHPADVATFIKQFTLPKDAGNLGQQRSFYVRVKNVTGGNSVKYEIAHFNATLKTRPPLRTPYHQGPQEDTVYLICIGRLVVDETIREFQPPMDLPLDQYHSYHSLDGRIIFLDQRVSLITGFMMHELRNLPAYAFVLPEDIPLVAWSHYYVLRGELPCTIFRARNKYNEMGHLRTESHLVVDMWTKKPRYIISINNLIIDPVKGDAALEEHRARYEALLAKEDPEVVKQMEKLINAGRAISCQSAEPGLLTRGDIIADNNGTQLDSCDEKCVLSLTPDASPRAVESSLAARNPILSAQLSARPVLKTQLAQDIDPPPSVLQDNQWLVFDSQSRHDSDVVPHTVNNPGCKPGPVEADSSEMQPVEQNMHALIQHILDEDYVSSASNFTQSPKGSQSSDSCTWDGRQRREWHSLETGSSSCSMMSRSPEVMSPDSTGVLSSTLAMLSSTLDKSEEEEMILDTSSGPQLLPNEAATHLPFELYRSQNFAQPEQNTLQGQTSDAVLEDNGAGKTSISGRFLASQISAGLKSEESSHSPATGKLQPLATRSSQHASAAESIEPLCTLPSTVDGLAGLALNTNSYVPSAVESWEQEVAANDRFFCSTLPLNASMQSPNSGQTNQHLSHILEASGGPDTSRDIELDRQPDTLVSIHDLLTSQSRHIAVPSAILSSGSPADMDVASPHQP